ncbi:MAG: DUF4388 domain-containing protein [Syntrophobacteraceae bacterium]|nr:DUF4388 domain-containing protein [Syntrophobacteraceae bacterium]
MDSSQEDANRFNGSIEYIRLIDLIQVSCLAKLSHVIRVDSIDKIGRFYLDAGKVIHAESGAVTGEEGFFDLLRWDAGHFETERLPEEVTNSINRTWEYLLIQALRAPRKTVEGQKAGAEAQGLSHGFRGQINDISLTDLIQLICLDSIDRIIKVRTRDLVGNIHVRGGQICHAATEDLVGQEAFFKLLNTPNGTFVTLPTSEESDTTINVPWEHLLIEATRIADESSGGKIDEKEAASRAQTLLQKIQKKNVSEKIRLAMLADKETRGILIRDSNRMIQLAVVSNPKLSDSEVAAMACSRQVDEEVLRRIAIDKEWLKIYTIRHALVANPKTPVNIARKLIPTLNRQDLRNIARSKSISSLVAMEAKRLSVKMA